MKIGSSSPDRFEARLNELQLMCPVELILIGRLDTNIEKRLHEQLMFRRLHGEWFRYDATTARVLAGALEPCRISALSGKQLGWQKAAKLFGQV